MRSNELGLLTLQNPFFLNHTRLRMFGVNIVTTPTLLSFLQLQNYIWLSLQQNTTTYFYGHMDVIALPYEDQYEPPSSNAGSVLRYSGFKSIYQGAVDTLRLATSSSPDPNVFNCSNPWAAQFFTYDRLTLVNREAYESIGGWDTLIPYYFTDCDMHDRLKMYGFDCNGPDDVKIGQIFDVAGSEDDLLVLYRKKDTIEASLLVDQPPPEPEKNEVISERNVPVGRETSSGRVSDEIGSPAFKKLLNTAESLANSKNGPHGRNAWQARQTGGKGEPHSRDSEGFERAVQMITQTGREV